MEPNDGNTGDVAQCDLRDNPPPCPSVSEVWDSLMVKKYNDPTCGQKRWRCHHCKHTFGSWNATKALAHVTKRRGRISRSAKESTHKSTKMRILTLTL